MIERYGLAQTSEEALENALFPTNEAPAALRALQRVATTVLRCWSGNYADFIGQVRHSQVCSGRIALSCWSGVGAGSPERYAKIRRRHGHTLLGEEMFMFEVSLSLET